VVGGQGLEAHYQIIISLVSRNRNITQVASQSISSKRFAYKIAVQHSLLDIVRKLERLFYGGLVVIVIVLPMRRITVVCLVKAVNFSQELLVCGELSNREVIVQIRVVFDELEPEAQLERRVRVEQPVNKELCVRFVVVDEFGR
jgi:hypothetical protein